MLLKGGSAIEAIRVLIKAGAPESSITFFNVVCCPDGIKNLLTTFPNVKIITGAVDPILNEKVQMMLFSYLFCFHSNLSNNYNMVYLEVHCSWVR